MYVCICNSKKDNYTFDFAKHVTDSSSIISC